MGSGVDAQWDQGKLPVVLFHRLKVRAQTCIKSKCTENTKILSCARNSRGLLSRGRKRRSLVVLEGWKDIRDISQEWLFLWVINDTQGCLPMTT